MKKIKTDNNRVKRSGSWFSTFRDWYSSPRYKSLYVPYVIIIYVMVICYNLKHDHYNSEQNFSYFDGRFI